MRVAAAAVDTAGLWAAKNRSPPPLAFVCAEEGRDLLGQTATTMGVSPPSQVQREMGSLLHPPRLLLDNGHGWWVR